jgi:hypothetical protein
MISQGLKDMSGLAKGGAKRLLSALLVQWPREECSALHVLATALVLCPKRGPFLGKAS